MIGSVECRFCRNCAERTHDGQCPNCGGDLVRRPARPAELLDKYLASAHRITL